VRNFDQSFNFQKLNLNLVNFYGVGFSPLPVIYKGDRGSRGKGEYLLPDGEIQTVRSRR
jgi:hypothetical protein